MFTPQTPLVITSILLVLTIKICSANGQECELSPYQLPYFQSEIQRIPIQLELNVSQRVNCYLYCDILGTSNSPSHCNISHDWILILPYRNQLVETVSRGNGNMAIDGLSINFDPVYFPSDICQNGQSNFSFSITLLMQRYSQELKEILAICGIKRPNTIPNHDVLRPVILKGGSDESMNVYSTDIDSNPNKEGQEHGNVSFTCTRPVDDELLGAYCPLWQLTSSNMLLSIVVVNESGSILLNNGDELIATLEGGEPYWDVRLKQVQDFTITLSNLSVNLSRLTLWCGVQTQDGQIQFYNRSASVTVLKEEFHPIYSNDSDRQPFLKLQTGTGEGKITCTKRKGYLSDVRVRLLDDNGTLSGELGLGLTFLTNQAMLKILGVNISESTDSNSGTLWENFDILLTGDVNSSMIVECGARKANSNHSEFYDHVVVTVLNSDPVPTVLMISKTTSDPVTNVLTTTDPVPNVCSIKDPESISSISTLSIVLLIALAVISIIAIKLYLLIRTREENAPRQQPGNPDEVQINIVAQAGNEIANINHGIYLGIGQEMVGRNEPPLELRRQNLHPNEMFEQDIHCPQNPEQHLLPHAQLKVHGVLHDPDIGPNDIVLSNQIVEQEAINPEQFPGEIIHPNQVVLPAHMLRQVAQD